MDALKWDIVDDPELNALGAWCDEHRDELDAEWDEAERRGEVYTLAELGVKNGLDAGRRIEELRAAGALPSRKPSSILMLPDDLADILKRKAKAEHRTYQSVAIDALWGAVG